MAAQFGSEDAVSMAKSYNAFLKACAIEFAQDDSTMPFALRRSLRKARRQLKQLLRTKGRSQKREDEVRTTALSPTAIDEVPEACEDGSGDPGHSGQTPDSSDRRIPASATLEQRGAFFRAATESFQCGSPTAVVLVEDIVNEILENPHLVFLENDDATETGRFKFLMDQLSALLVCEALDLKPVRNEENRLLRCLKRWAERGRVPRTIFQRAIDSARVSWDDPLLRYILSHDDGTCQPHSAFHRCKSEPDQSHCPALELSLEEAPVGPENLFAWSEPTLTACSRVAVLRFYGFRPEAARLASAVALSLKDLQKNWVLSGRRSSSRESLKSSLQDHAECWIGHFVDPINSLFDALAEKSPPLWALAVEVALIGLGRQRLIPRDPYHQAEMFRQETTLMRKLEDIKIDPPVLEAIRKQAKLLLEGGRHSGLGSFIHPESAPVYKLARFIFKAVLSSDPNLAFEVGIRALRPFMTRDQREGDTNALADSELEVGVPSNNSDRMTGEQSRREENSNPDWAPWTLIEGLQRSLALTMISGAENDRKRLETVFEAVRKNILNFDQLYRIAQDVFILGTRYVAEEALFESDLIPDFIPERRQLPLLEFAFKLGEQLLKMSYGEASDTRFEIVRWFVNCAVEIGKDALVPTFEKWQQLFLPYEAILDVAPTVLDRFMRPWIGDELQKELLSRARIMARQCVLADAPKCAKIALLICEKNETSLEAVLHAIEAAVKLGQMESRSLFDLARYMKLRGHDRPAFKLGFLGMEMIKIQRDDDSHPDVDNVRWTFSLAQSLGSIESTWMISILVKNVRCATVLRDLLKSAVACGGSRHISSMRRKLNNTPLRELLSATISAFCSTARSRAATLSPQGYASFVRYVLEAYQTFALAPDGHERFMVLLRSPEISFQLDGALAQWIVSEVIGAAKQNRMHGF